MNKQDPTKETTPKKKNMLVELMDSMFIMVLCFATLLTAMLITSNFSEKLSYVINAKTLGAVVAGLICYLMYVLLHSEKELKEMIHQLYQTKPLPDLQKTAGAGEGGTIQ